DGSRDLVPEKSILLEAGFDELNGVDWQKGCYIGQELTARTKYRGLVKRRLVPVRIEGPAPPPGAIVTADGREIGEMRSSRDGLGLALLRIEPLRDGKKLAATGATLVPLKPAWMQRC
ncbi:MAG: folate-binding protein, partial [Alphaproteobacteria bacterium]|nr:folate-binding protein [Alphaproteobacteria bacterium]